MSEGTTSLLHHILSILENGLPSWAVASPVACLCILAALAVLARRLGPIITVTVDNHTIDTGEMSSRTALRKRPLTDTRTSTGRWRAELSRIARLEGEDDAELWIS